MTSPGWSIRDLCVRYKNVDAVRGISFDLARGSSLALLGHNGAGKSSTLLALGGGLDDRGHCSGSLVQRDDGERTVPIGGARPAGVTLVPERNKVFGLLSVQDNLLAADRAGHSGHVRIPDVYGFFPRLAERRGTLAGNLSGGEQQMLAIGIALLGSPQLLLVDEPTLGLSELVIVLISNTLADLRRELGLTLLLALAETAWAEALADTAIVMDRGELACAPMVVASGAREQLERILAGEGRDTGGSPRDERRALPGDPARHA